MNDFLALAQSRFSVRKFTDEKISQEIVDNILKAGQLAPTACNNQPQHIYVIKSDEALTTLQKCKTQHFNEQLALLVCYDKNKCWTREYDGKTSGDIDGAIVTTHMMLQACQDGIGSTWIMHFDPEITAKEFHIPDNIVPVSLLVLGHYENDVQPTIRHTEKKPLEQLVEYL